MEKFVNRTDELNMIDGAMFTLKNGRELLKTPIIEFYGVQGIGKTMLLRNVELLCTDKHELFSIWAEPQNAPTHFVHAREVLDTHRPVVMLLDALDAMTPEQLHTVESGLHSLIDNAYLFVVMASRSQQNFSTRSIARKLETRPLKPLGRESCTDYFDGFGSTIASPIRDAIFEWTGGYPLAMNVMTNAILDDHLDPLKEQDQKHLIQTLTEQVVNQKLLATVAPNERSRYEILLGLLSVPRRFNLVLMQDLIETYAPNYRLASRIAYMSLPGTITQAANVLNWEMSRSGYSIDAPVRNLFLLKFKIEQPERYIEIHRFLAQKNKSFAQQVTGSDRIRYLREFFYHLANCEGASHLPATLQQQIEQIAQEETPDDFMQFYEELKQDEELRTLLGQDFDRLLARIFQDVLGKGQ